MSYYIYAVNNYVCSSIILSVKFAVSCPWPEVDAARVSVNSNWVVQLFAVAAVA